MLSTIKKNLTFYPQNTETTQNQIFHFHTYFNNETWLLLTLKIFKSHALIGNQTCFFVDTSISDLRCIKHRVVSLLANRSFCQATCTQWRPNIQVEWQLAKYCFECQCSRFVLFCCVMFYRIYLSWIALTKSLSPLIQKSELTNTLNSKYISENFIQTKSSIPPCWQKKKKMQISPMILNRPVHFGFASLCCKQHAKKQPASKISSSFSHRSLTSRCGSQTNTANYTTWSHAVGLMLIKWLSESKCHPSRARLLWMWLFCDACEWVIYYKCK